MDQNLGFWIALAAIGGGVVIGGIYEVVPAGSGGESTFTGSYILNRFTGDGWLCFRHSCRPLEFAQ